MTRHGEKASQSILHHSRFEEETECHGIASNTSDTLYT